MEKCFIEYTGYGPDISTAKAAIDHENKFVLIGEYEGNRSTAAANVFESVVASIRREDNLDKYEILYWDNISGKVFSYSVCEGIEEWDLADQEKFLKAVETLKEGYLGVRLR